MPTGFISSGITRQLCTFYLLGASLLKVAHLAGTFVDRGVRVQLGDAVGVGRGEAVTANLFTALFPQSEKRLTASLGYNI